MADRVRARMEAMVPELEDLQNRGLATRREVKLLAQRREHFEYLLVGRAPSREDFLHYLQLEMNLEMLLRVRSKAGQGAKLSPASVAVRKRVHYIFDRAVRRFKEDELMWLQWIDYAERTGAHTKLARVFARALALHPTNSRMWTRAAAWEMEGRNNASSARKLLQRGLRLNRKDAELWAAYFRFELVFLTKAQQRQEVLGLTTAVKEDDEDDEDDEGEGEDADEDEDEEGEEEEDKNDDDDDDDEDEDDDDDEDEEEDEDEGEDEEDEEDEAGEEEDDDEYEVEGGGTEGAAEGAAEEGAGGEVGLSQARLAIPLLVFEQAAAAMPQCAEAQLAMLRTCYDFAGSAPLRRELHARIRAAFASDAAAVVALAAMPLDAAQRTGGWGEAHSAAVRRGLRQLEAAARAAEGGAAAVRGALLEAYAGWLEALLRTPAMPAALARQLRRRLLRTAKRAHQAAAASAALYLRWAALRLAPSAAALRALPPLAAAATDAASALLGPDAAGAGAAAALRVCGAGLARHPADVPLLCLRLRLRAAALGARPTLRALRPVLAGFDAAIDAAGGQREGQAALWRLRLAVVLGAADARAQPRRVLGVLQAAALATRGGAGPLKPALAAWLADGFGLERCRELRTELLQLPPTPADAYAPLLAHEETADDAALAALPRGAAAPMPPPLRALYELALSEHARDAPGVWLRYAQRCIARADYAAAAAVHERAVRALAEEHHAEFVASYRAAVAAVPGAEWRDGPAKPAKRRRTTAADA